VRWSAWRRSRRVYRVSRMVFECVERGVTSKQAGWRGEEKRRGRRKAKERAHITMPFIG
jgi:hypothetical protein